MADLETEDEKQTRGGTDLLARASFGERREDSWIPKAEACQFDSGPSTARN